MTTSTYNGWTNWETWNVALWIDNEEPLYRAKVEFIKRGKLHPIQVEAFIREIYPKGTPDFDSPKDLKKVNWDEIAENWAEEAKEYE